jgi:hypothetical protein
MNQEPCQPGKPLNLRPFAIGRRYPASGERVVFYSPAGALDAADG